MLFVWLLLGVATSFHWPVAGPRWPIAQRATTESGETATTTKFATCAHCQAVYVLRDSDLGTGRRVRCSVCGNEWFQTVARLRELFTDFELEPYNETRRATYQAELEERGKPSSARATTTLFVANLPFGATVDDLVGLFEAFVDDPGVTIIKDSSGRSKGYGFVDCRDATLAQRAIDALNEQDFQGRRLIVKLGNTNTRKRRADP
mmetsp:Transcript_2727/g.8583  ORF Transcript_2727/g.8583 Transcript_2727/m.8583 type:complete len:205 (-) Transcript_2727:159-773(-)